MPKDHNQKIRLIAITLSFGIGLALMVAKFYIFYLTRSSAILSDALESIINVVASAFAAFSIWIAAKPPDEDHPYGHGKIEYFSAGFEGALIIIAAIGIFKTGFEHLLSPVKLPNLGTGLILLASTGVINLILGMLLVRVGRKTVSLSLIADGKHILTDVYTSVGVILGLGLVHVTEWLWLDGAIACIVGVNIVVTGIKLISQAFSGLMDTSDVQLLDEISDLLNNHRKPYWIDIHQLRAWRSGNHIHIDFHLVLPRNFSLVDTHREIKSIEQLTSDHFEDRSSVLVHTDPCDDAQCPICIHNDCIMRSQSHQLDPDWSRKRLTHDKKLD